MFTTPLEGEIPISTKNQLRVREVQQLAQVTKRTVAEPGFRIPTMWSVGAEVTASLWCSEESREAKDTHSLLSKGADKENWCSPELKRTKKDWVGGVEAVSCSHSTQSPVGMGGGVALASERGYSTSLTGHKSLSLPSSHFHLRPSPPGLPYWEGVLSWAPQPDQGQESCWFLSPWLLKPNAELAQASA